jgi:VanZ family protein
LLHAHPPFLTLPFLKQILTHTGAFTALLLISAAAGFSPPDYSIPSYKQSDKALHFLAFFLLTLCFYWILETSRRKVLQVTFVVCTLGLGVASEVVQGVLPVRIPAFSSFIEQGWMEEGIGMREEREGKEI